MIHFNSNIIPDPTGAYIVGGSIRDILLGRAPTDYDIAVSENPGQFAKALASNTNGHLVVLGKPGQMIYRVATRNYNFDISPLSGPSIEADLSQRDFTINAMAYSLSSGRIIDRLGSRRDLANKCLRMVSREAFKKDPVRLIRAYRLAASLQLQIEPSTQEAIKKHANLIRRSAGERIKAELFKMFGTPKSYDYVAQMVDTGLLFEIFPELIELKKCVSNRYHRQHAFEHTLRAFYHLEKILNQPEALPSDISQMVSRRIDQGKAALLKCAILLHDIGKPLPPDRNKDGDFHFDDHQQQSAQIARATTMRLKFSTREAAFVDDIIRNHMRPLHLFNTRKKSTLDLMHFFMQCGDHTPELLLHAMADIRGKRAKKKHEAFLPFAEAALRLFFTHFKPESLKPPLITGHDLIKELGLRPSPVFKTILNRVQAENLAGRIKTKAAALNLAKDLLKAL